MDSTQPYAFTGRFTTFRNRIVSDVWLCPPGAGNNNAAKIRALWDTGCSHTIVSKRVADFLNLPAAGTRIYHSPFGGRHTCELKLAKICVVLGAARLEIEVGVDEQPSSDPDCDITLGLDFITRGDFALTHDGLQLVLSFCYPPVEAPADFTLIAPRIHSGPVLTESCVVDETDAAEHHRRELIMLAYFTEVDNRKGR